MPRNSRIQLNAIRAFETTVRLGSVKAAAAELCVTEGAVSRQIKKLEEVLSLSLVRRDHQAISATLLGDELAKEFSTALDLIDKTISQAQENRTRIRLQVAPSFAIRWLMPRLEALRKSIPSLDVRVTTTLLGNQFDRYSFDAGIIYGDGKWPDLISTKLSDEYLAPILPPQHQENAHSLTPQIAFKTLTFLHTTADQRDWKLWLQEAGHTGVMDITGPAFETLDLAVRAAENGFGISLGDLALITEEIEKQRLCVPFGPVLKTGRGYYLVHPPTTLHTKALEEFTNWALKISPQHNINMHNFTNNLGLSII
ncbi:LysR substrate-binding domain-containing protein [Kiloniella sp.]|uniref:LysR substrate-binding domain-containing protein n=1 Tax=Kiloniella sp. TaxID=1938587 RepID=UPI003B025075